MQDVSKRIWGVAAVVAIAAFLVLAFLARYGTVAALVLALLTGLLVALVMWIFETRGRPDAVQPLRVHETDASRGGARQAVHRAAAIETKPAITAAPAQPRASSRGARGRTAGDGSGRPNPGPTRNPAGADRRPAPRPAVKPRSEADPADDLKRIKGVGPTLERKLHDLGVTTLSQVAAWSEADIDRVDQALKFSGRIRRDGWVEQAKILAEGGETEFSKKAKTDDDA